MRILFLYMFPLWGNGSASYLRELTAQLKQRGHDVAILAPDKRKLPGIVHFVATPAQMGVFAGHPELPQAKKFQDMNGKELGEIYASYLYASIAAVADFQPDIIHVFHTAFLPGIARTIKVLFGIKYVITTHGSDLSYLVQDRRFIGLINDANRVASYITANSEFTKKWYLKLFGQKLKRKTSVILGGVNIQEYVWDNEAVAEINRKYNLRGQKVVLFTGRLTVNKGVVYLIRAAARINAKVVIVGDGPERKNLEKEIARRNLTNVVMTGYIPTKESVLLHALYARADVYVCPSIWDEPLGLTILEAMAAHTPVVATNRGGIVSIIKDGSNGILVRARNAKEIANAVNTLLTVDAVHENMAMNAYATILNKFTWVKIADQFEQLYQKFTYSTKEYLEVVRGKEGLPVGK